MKRAFLFLLIPMAVLAQEPLTIPLSSGNLLIHPKNFRFSFTDETGKTLAPAHFGAGASLNGSALSLEERIDEKSYTLISLKGERVRLNILHENGHTQFTMVPEKPSPAGKPHLFAVQLGGMPYAYGLGDAGGWNETLNLVNETETTYQIKHDGGKKRWMSSFAIFPQNKIAGVCFGESQTVTLSKKNYKMAISSPEVAVFSFFTGEMKEIYTNYQRVLIERGYPIVRPKKRLFELGWESWAALGWQTNSQTMENSITALQEAGFPIRWAVSGSGYWEEGGTTTSFGKWGKKFPQAMELKKRLHARDVKWMIGLRTNFVPDGGPFAPVTEARDQNMVVDTFKGNPLSRIAVEKGYFLRKPNGDLWQRSSACFPIVPCYLLDGANSEAVKWYGEQYQDWQIDGIKEDTMMNLGTTIDTFNKPIAHLAENEALVMARCGSYTAPGTLLRINDTNVGETSKRIPINYLQYAACGAPNVYSDTVGFKRMKTYSELVVRHAWLQALTAGMAVGESCAHWTPEQQETFKKPFRIHTRLIPTLYEAALKSYETGYPYTMTPLAIAYPDGPAAVKAPHFQWFIGENLLCTPLLKNHQSGKMDIYLPAGTWVDYDTEKEYTGPQLLKDVPMPVTKTPLFLRAGHTLKE